MFDNADFNYDENVINDANYMGATASERDSRNVVNYMPAQTTGNRGKDVTRKQLIDKKKVKFNVVPLSLDDTTATRTSSRAQDEAAASSEKPPRRNPPQLSDILTP